MADQHFAMYGTQYLIVDQYVMDFDSGNDVRDDLGLRQREIGNGAHRWRRRITLETDIGGAKKLAAHYSAFRADRGYSRSFPVPMVQWEGLSEIPAAPAQNPMTNAAIAAGATMFGIDGPNVASVQVGHYFAFGGHNRVYQVAGVAGSGNTRTITPAPFVKAAIPDNTRLNFNPIDLSVFAAESPASTPWSDGIVVRVSFDIVSANA